MEMDTLRDMILEAASIVAFTGAGISAESGIPTYRGSDGIWNRYDPDKYANINYFYRDPRYYWSFFQEVRYPVLSSAKPNPAHLLLARMESRGRLTAVVTQNIDGLHQQAGSQKVLELHGSTRSFTCLGCGRRFDLDEVAALLEAGLPPPCRTCSGLIRPDTVMFGEALPGDVLAESRDLAGSCDLFLSIGSSLLVQPAASLPVLAKRAGAGLVIINRDPSRLDSLADLVIHDSASKVLAGALGE